MIPSPHFRLDQLLEFDSCALSYVSWKQESTNKLYHTLCKLLSEPGDKHLCTDYLSWDFCGLIYPGLQNNIRPHFWHIQPSSFSPTLQELTFEISMPYTFPLKTVTVIMRIDLPSVFFFKSAFPSCLDEVLYSHGCFLSWP